MSVFNRRKRLSVPDGEYPAIATIQGQPERTYALRVKDGFPSLVFPILISNSPTTYHLIEVRSENIVKISNGDEGPLFGIAEVLPDPHPFIGIDKSKSADYGNLYIALNVADTDQAALVRGEHVLFATKGRVSWRGSLNFLMDYLHFVLGQQWLENQTEYSHPLVILIAAVRNEISLIPLNDEGEKIIPRGNPVILWFLDFSYNLFIVALNQKLEDRSIRRLQNPKLFWSTVHEVFVASLFLRNGFEIRLEDEDDRSSRHPEFIAVHKTSNTEFAVEAKLANQSMFSETMDFRKWNVPNGFRYKSLLNDAVDKNTKQPLIVVLDLNRLPNNDNQSQKAFNNYMYREINSISPDNGELDRWSRIEFVNRPFLLSASKGAAFMYSSFTVQSFNSVYTVSPIEAVSALNAVFGEYDVYQQIESLEQHLKHVLSNTRNRFRVMDPRRADFSPIPPDWKEPEL